MRNSLSFALYFFVTVSAAAAQQGVAPAPGSAAPSAPIDRRDIVLDAAGALVGKPLFLRCFCAENNLVFDANGKPAGTAKSTDWTVAAVNVQKTSRKAAGTIELDGVRVVISYNATTREFQRHPQADDKMRITLPDSGDMRAFQRTVDAIFAIGIDVPLQRAMPDYWLHYFDPKMAWTRDAVSGVPVYVPGDAGLVLGVPLPVNGAKAGPPVSSPEVAHKASAQYTTFAQRDHVAGKTQLRFIVDAEGLPHEISIVQPQGYGLDERAAEAVMKMRFTPAMREGKPVAATVLLNQEFELIASPR